MFYLNAFYITPKLVSSPSSLVSLHHYTSHKRTTFFRHTSNRSGSIFLVGQGVDNSTHGGKIYRSSSNSNSNTSSRFFFYAVVSQTLRGRKLL